MLPSQAGEWDVEGEEDKSSFDKGDLKCWPGVVGKSYQLIKLPSAPKSGKKKQHHPEDRRMLRILGVWDGFNEGLKELWS